MDRRHLLVYGAAFGIGAAVGISVPRFIEARRKNIGNPILGEDYKAYFRVSIYSEEYLKEKEGEKNTEISKLFSGGELSSVDFCFSSAYYHDAQLFIGEDLLFDSDSAKNPLRGYTNISTREIGRVVYTLVLKNTKVSETVTLPVDFKDNMDLMAVVSAGSLIRGEGDESVLFEDFSRGYPRRAVIDRKRDIEYHVYGLEAIAETSPENLKEYFGKIMEYRSYDDYLARKKMEEARMRPGLKK
jgi:hypothetical protein